VRFPWLQSASRILNRAEKTKKDREGKRPVRPLRHGLSVEQLEERVVPTITPVPDFAHNAVAFDGSAGDNLHLRVVGGQLQYSPDGVTFSADIDPTQAGIQTFTVNNASVISTDVGGTTFIDGMTLGAGTYSATSDIEIDSSIATEGNNLTFVSGGNISVAKTAASIISTRERSDMAAMAAGRMFPAPGPPMHIQTPNRPPIRAYPSAMNPAPSSCAATIACRPVPLPSSATKGSMCPPGTRKTCPSP
jgi:hypothetical protein